MSDPFDDETFFSGIDLSALDECEAQAIHDTQSVARRTKFKEHDNALRYHHTVASPRQELSTKEPRPLNTEPRAGGKSTFGFGEGGKHAHPGNEIRLVENVRKRKEYWGLRRDDDEERTRPTVTVDPTGRYGILIDDEGDEEDDDRVVDLHAPGARAHALANQASFARPVNFGSQAAMARRAAIAEAGAEAPPAKNDDLAPSASTTGRHACGNTRPISMAGPARVLSRSVSTGSHVLARSKHAPHQQMYPIASQSSSSQPHASQATQLRRSAMELEDEKRQREELEVTIKQLNAELARSKSAPRHWMDGLNMGEDAGLSEQRFKTLQTDLWIARGEAETTRRAQKEVGVPFSGSSLS